MILTEEEAKERWCHQATLSTSNCLASGCMAWRWALEEIDWATKGPVTQGTPLGMVTYQRSTTRGYCGLAGKPSTGSPGTTPGRRPLAGSFV